VRRFRIFSTRITALSIVTCLTAACSSFQSIPPAKLVAGPSERTPSSSLIYTAPASFRASATTTNATGIAYWSLVNWDNGKMEIIGTNLQKLILWKAVVSQTSSGFVAQTTDETIQYFSATNTFLMNKRAGSTSKSIATYLQSDVNAAYGGIVPIQRTPSSSSKHVLADDACFQAALQVIGGVAAAFASDGLTLFLGGLSLLGGIVGVTNHCPPLPANMQTLPPAGPYSCYLDGVQVDCNELQYAQP